MKLYVAKTPEQGEALQYRVSSTATAQLRAISGEGVAPQQKDILQNINQLATVDISPEGTVIYRKVLLEIEYRNYKIALLGNLINDAIEFSYGGNLPPEARVVFTSCYVKHSGRLGENINFLAPGMDEWGNIIDKRLDSEVTSMAVLVDDHDNGFGSDYTLANGTVGAEAVVLTAADSGLGNWLGSIISDTISSAVMHGTGSPNGYNDPTATQGSIRAQSALVRGLQSSVMMNKLSLFSGQDEVSFMPVDITIGELDAIDRLQIIEDDRLEQEYRSSFNQGEFMPWRDTGYIRENQIAVNILDAISGVSAKYAIAKMDGVLTNRQSGFDVDTGKPDVTLYGGRTFFADGVTENVALKVLSIEKSLSWLVSNAVGLEPVTIQFSIMSPVVEIVITFHDQNDEAIPYRMDSTNAGAAPVLLANEALAGETINDVVGVVNTLNSMYMGA